jgi:putative exporter of polyketide antibiotics
MLSPGYVGIPAPAGEQTVTMTYRSPRWTRLLMWAGIACLALVAAADLRRRRHRPPQRRTSP